MGSLEGLPAELADRRLTRRRFLERAAGLGLSGVAAAALVGACGDEADDDGGAPASPSPSLAAVAPEKLYVYSWRNQLAPANREKFRARTGITIVETYYDSNESLLANLQAGATGFDLIVPSSYMVATLAEEDLLQPLHPELLPNLENVKPRFQEAPYDPGVEGQRFSVPWLWGTTGIAVRKDLVSSEIDSWTALWDGGNQGRIDMLNDGRECLGAALKALGFSLNTTVAEELEAAGEKLVEQKRLVRAYDSVNMQRNIIHGVPLVHTWSGDANRAIDGLGTDKVGFVLPDEGFAVWLDCACIPRGARSPYGAHLFVDFMLEGENAADLVNATEYYSPNEAAQTYLRPEIYARTPSEDDLSRGETIENVGPAAAAYDDAWARVKGA